MLVAIFEINPTFRLLALFCPIISDGFLFCCIVGVAYISRLVVHSMSSKVPSDLTWVDLTVLTLVSVIDNEYAEAFRRHHRLCLSREDERNYEIVVTDPEERVCFPDLIGRTTFHICLCLFLFEVRGLPFLF